MSRWNCRNKCVNVCRGLRYDSIKFAQTYLQKCITWPKKLRKGRQKWMRTCINANLVVITCILNQSRGQWLLGYALHVTISTSIKLKEAISHFILDTLMKNDLKMDIDWLGTLIVNMKKIVFGVNDSFLSILTKYDERKTHNMLSLMLNLKFKSLIFFFPSIGCQQRVAIKNMIGGCFSCVFEVLLSFASIIQGQKLFCWQNW